MKKWCKIFVFALAMLLTFAFVFMNSTNSVRAFDKDPEKCNHSKIDIADPTEKNIATQLNNWKYKGSEINKEICDLPIYHFNIARTSKGKLIVTYVANVTEECDVAVHYWLNQNNTSYGKFYIDIELNNTNVVHHDYTATACPGWQSYLAHLTPGKNTLSVLVEKIDDDPDWADSNGRNMYIGCDSISDFDENGRCNQCGLQCTHSHYIEEFDENEHRLVCGDVCGNVLEATRAPHDFDSDHQCMYCGYTSIEKDASGYYLIGSPGQLITFARLVNDMKISDVKAKLTADLDMNNVDYIPIGSKSCVYAGEFDGQGHYICNYKVESDGDEIGFFKKIGTNGLKNAYIHDLIMDSSCSVKGKQYVGCMIATISGKATLTRCGNEGTVVATNALGLAGGLVGSGTATYTSCYNAGSVTGSSGVYTYEGTSWQTTIGGICGFSYSSVLTGCYNSGVINTIYDPDFNGSSDKTNVNEFAAVHWPTWGKGNYNDKAITSHTAINTYTPAQLTNGQLVTNLNKDVEGTPFKQGTDHPILYEKQLYKDAETCTTHEYKVTAYNWGEGYADCEGVAVCKNCGELLTEQVTATKDTQNVANQKGLQKTTYTANFTNGVFATQKIRNIYSVIPSHKITLHGNGGEGSYLGLYYEGIVETLPTDYTQVNYDFMGWYDNQWFTGEPVTQTPANATTDLDYYAKFVIGEHEHDPEYVGREEPTCDRDGHEEGRVCLLCGEVLSGCAPIYALGHDWDDGVVIQDSTLEEEGLIQYTCKRNYLHTKTETLPKKKTELSGDTPDVVIKTKGGDPFDGRVYVSVSLSLRAQIESDYKAKTLNFDLKKLEAKRTKIGAIYDVVLYKLVNNVKIVIQPSDIAPGTILIVEMDIPEKIKAKDIVDLLHIHNDGTYESVQGYAIEGNKIVFETDSFSQFAIVTKDSKCAAHWLILLFFIIYVITMFIFVLACKDIKKEYKGEDDPEAKGFKKFMLGVKKFFATLSVADLCHMIADFVYLVLLIISCIISHCAFCVILDVIGFIVLGVCIFVWFFRNVAVNVLDGKKEEGEDTGKVGTFMDSASFATSCAMAESIPEKKLSKESISEYLAKNPNLIINRRKDAIGTGVLPLPDTIFATYDKGDGKKGKECFAFIYNLKDDKTLILVKATKEEIAPLQAKYKNICLSKFPVGGKWYSIPVEESMNFDDIAALLDMLEAKFSAPRVEAKEEAK